MENRPESTRNPSYNELDEARLEILPQEFATTRSSQPDILWYERSSGEILSVAINGDRAWLMYLREEGDAGFTSRNPTYTGPKDATLPYILDNGQEDEYPVSWTITTDEAMRSVEYFLRYGGKAPGVAWHDDYFSEEYRLDSGEILNVFVHDEHVWLKYRRSKKDTGFSSRNPKYSGPKEVIYEYILDNGQQVEYPASWTLSKEEASRAFEYFLRHGEKAPWVTWHDDSLKDESE